MDRKHDVNMDRQHGPTVAQYWAADGAQGANPHHPYIDRPTTYK